MPSWRTDDSGVTPR